MHGIVRFEHGWNVTDRPIAYDFGINMAFATRRPDAYGPIRHQEVVALREIADGSSATTNRRLTAMARARRRSDLEPT